MVYGNNSPGRTSLPLDVEDPRQQNPTTPNRGPGAIVAWLCRHEILSIATAIGIVALGVAINSMYTSWKGLEISRVALDLSHKELQAAYLSSSYAYYGYMAALVQVRLQIMELCALNLTIYETTCAKIRTWEYFSAVYEIYHPDRPYQPAPVANSTTPNPDLPPRAVAIVTVGSVVSAAAIAALVAYFARRLGR